MARKKILLIDDEETMHVVVSSSLRIGAQWQTLYALSAVEGLSLAQQEQPDAILLDVMMPDIDGIALLQQLHENGTTCNIPIILFTAKAQTGELLKLEAVGAAGVITKPFNSLTLANQIATILNWPLSL